MLALCWFWHLSQKVASQLPVDILLVYLEVYQLIYTKENRLIDLLSEFYAIMMTSAKTKRADATQPLS